MAPRSGSLIGIGAVLLALLAIVVGLWPSGDPDPVQPEPVSMTINTSKLGSPWNPESVGLSLEASELAEPTLASGDFADYLNLLGRGTLRFAANAVDETFWTSANEEAPKWSSQTLTPEDLDRLAALAKDSSWNVMLGVNFKHLDPKRAADQVAHAQRVLGKQLTAIQIGNEPDVYYDNFDRYISDYENYAREIRTVAPDVKFVGGDFQGRHNFPELFAKHQAARPTVSALATHFYPLSQCKGNKKPTVAKLLDPAQRTYQEDIAKRFVEQAGTAKLPATVDETNTVSCEGASNVSDTYASAIWAADYALMAQRAGITSVDFHGSLSKCKADRPKYKFYTPLCSDGEADTKIGALTAQPQFNGLLTLRQIPAGKFATVDNPGWKHVRTFAITNDSSTTLVLVNIDDAKNFGPSQITAKFDKKFAKASASSMETMSDKGLSAKTDITLGGHRIQKNAQFEDPLFVDTPVVDGAVTIETKPGSVTLVKLA